MKKIQQWFDEVGDSDLQTKLKTNLDPNWADTEVDSFPKAVSHGFFWSSSPEGFDYWNKVAAEINTPQTS